MNKRLPIIISTMIIALQLWAAPIFYKEGELKIPYEDKVNSHYSLSINCNNESCAFINGILFVTKGENITISYTGAHQGGGGRGGYITKDTKLTVYDFNLKKLFFESETGAVPQTDYPLTISENVDYYVSLNIICKTQSSEENVSEVKIRIVGVEADNICNISFLSENDKQKCIKGFTGKLNPYVESENAFIKPMGTTYPVWYVKKGTALEYLFYDNRLASNMSDVAPISQDIQMHPSNGSIVKINGKEKNWIDIFKNRLPLKAEEDMDIEVWDVHDGPDGHGASLASKVVIIVDDNGPEMTLPEGIQFNDWTNESVTISVKDETTGIDYLSIKNEETDFKEEKVYSSIFDMSDYASGKYEVTAYDNVNNQTEQHVWIDKTGPEIIFCEDENHQYPISFTADKKWTKQDIYLDFKDDHSGLSKYTDSLSGVKEKGLITGTGEHEITAFDNLGNETKTIIYIDQLEPAFATDESYYVDDAGNRFFQLSLTNIFDEHSGVAEITVTPILNGVEKEKESVDIRNEKGQKRINNKTFTYKIPDNNIDNYVKFIVTVTDEAGNPNKIQIPLGGKNGYFVPAAIYYEVVGNKDTEKNRVKVNFYRGYSKSACETKNYTSIRLKRHFLLKNSKNPDLWNAVTDESFGDTDAFLFNTSTKNIWKKLTSETGSLKITTNAGESYYTDTAIENTGFTHKNILYDCIYEYTNPVNPAETITETICNDTKIKLTNNKGRYSIRVKGEDNTYLVINDKGEIIEGSTESFKMPDTAVVGLAIKVEDPDIEPCNIQLQGYVELTSEKGKFKLQETDTIPVETKGAIAGCGKTELRSDNKNMFISFDKPMDGNWVELGDYALQYNITTVLSVEFTEGFPGSEEEWTDKSVRLYAQAPSVLGGKARLLVGEAGSYNADGITARPWQPFKMEIVPADENQTVTELFWDFGNGLTSDACGDYDKKSNSKFENIYYKQSEKRTGALSEYKLRIRTGSDEAEFKVNIIDTQFGKLYGDEVWRGEHIIKKEIIVPQNMKLQIGDTAHSEYDSDIKCLCVGKINAEDKGGITVGQGGELILDEGEAKTIRFVQAGFKDDKYVEVAEEEKSWQNKWRGIVVKGNLSGDSLNLFDADCGLTVFPGVSIELSDSIKMENCGNGILMNGESLKVKEIKLNKCSVYGLKLNSTLECEKLFVSNSGRGVVLTENGSLTADNFEIKDSITGIHLLGGNLKIESGRISGCSEYGIKTDKDGSYNYESVIVENNERNIYENGIIK